MSRLPMLANPIDIDDIERKCAGYVMEYKLDGWRAIITKRGDTVTMTSRSAKQDFAPKVPHLVEAFLQSEVDFILDCELGYMDDDKYVLDYNRTARVLGSSPEVAIDKQRDDGTRRIEAIVFDCLWHPGNGSVEERPQHVRRDLAAGLVYGAINHTDVSLIPQMPKWNMPDYLEYVGYDGGEGMMLKNPDALYVPGKRPTRNWYKVKKFETVDAYITGYLDGQGKYAGQIGALIFMTAHGRTGKCSGMDDETRSLISSHRDEYLGRWFELRYFGSVGKDEQGLRHPQFIRWRDDRDA